MPLDTARLPWSVLGRVQNDALGGRCTGSLIGPGTVLTAAHCVVSFRTGCFLQPVSLHFVLGYGQGQHTGHARVVRYVVPPSYVPSQIASGDDWAVLTLDRPLASPERVLRLAEASEVAVSPGGYPVALAGYQQDRKEMLMGDVGCRVVAQIHDDSGRPMLRHTCAATRGASGAPVLARGPDGGWIVAGVAAGARRDLRAAPQGTAYVGVSGGAAVPASAIDPSAAIQPVTHLPGQSVGISSAHTSNAGNR